MMKRIIQQGRNQAASFMRMQEKSIHQLNKEFEIYGYRIDIIKNTGLFRRIREFDGI
jgi:hypothetical protein